MDIKRYQDRSVTEKWDDSDEFDSDWTENDSRLTSIIVGNDNQTAVIGELTVQPDGKYSIVTRIDRGGMKTILEVKDSDTLRDMAMAVLTEKESPADIFRFVREARITANLEHPNIMPIHDIGIDKTGLPYFTMKRVKGETLANIIRNLSKGQAHYRRKYNLPHLLQIFRKICDAVGYAHSKGIIHLDLKPSNILVGSYGEVLVLDWGLAKIIGSELVDGDEEEEKRELESLASEHNTVDGEIKGTPGYMAPEQAAGRNREKDKRTDIYALGSILYFILTWQKPIIGRDLDRVFHDTITGNIPSPRRRAPDRFIPEALEAITLKAMAVDPNGRYQHIRKLIKDLDKFAGGFATSAEEANWFRHLTLLVRRRKIESILTLVVIFFTLAISAIWLTNRMKRMATWGNGMDISPDSPARFVNEWIVKDGNWRLDDGKLLATSGKGSSFRIYYDKPVYGNIALEFDGMVKSAEDLDKSGDLSVIFSGNPKSNEGYYLQTGGVGNSLAVIQRRGGSFASVNFSLKPGRIYHIRAEKEGAWLRLYCDGKLLLQTRDMFYLEGGYVGLYTFGKGKEFWNIRLFHRGVPELVSPLFEGDGYYRQSRAAKGDLRKLFLRLAKKSYNRVYESYPNKELGFQALLKKAYVNIELGNLAEARFDCGSLKNHYQNLEQQLLRAELAFCDKNYQEAYSICQRAIIDYPHSRIGIVGFLSGKLSFKTTADMDEKILMKFWRLCAANQITPILRCRDRALPSLEFLKGLDFNLIDCSNNQIESLEPLRGMKNLRQLDCAANKIKDLSPLQGLKLTNLECYDNQIEDINVLKDMPLQTLALHGCRNLDDISVLKNCRTLERLTIPRHLKNIDFLRKLPNLKYLNDKWDAWNTTAEEFWKKRDRNKIKR